MQRTTRPKLPVPSVRTFSKSAKLTLHCIGFSHLLENSFLDSSSKHFTAEEEQNISALLEKSVRAVLVKLSIRQYEKQRTSPLRGIAVFMDCLLTMSEQLSNSDAPAEQESNEQKRGATKLLMKARRTGAGYRRKPPTC